MDSPDKAAGAPQMFHASAVAVQGKGLLITGRAGAGKSSLALKMMAMGAALVSDDQTIATRRNDEVHLSAPNAIQGMIEARGIGLLGAQYHEPVVLVAVLDLDQMESQRLPPFRSTQVLGLRVPLLHNSAWDAFPAALTQYLKGGRRD